MEIELQYQLLIVILLVCFLTYHITRNYFKNIIKMQDGYIEAIKKDYFELEAKNKENKEVHDYLVENIGMLNHSIELLNSEICKLQNNNTIKQIGNND